MLFVEMRLAENKMDGTGLSLFHCCPVWQMQIHLPAAPTPARASPAMGLAASFV